MYFPTNDNCCSLSVVDSQLIDDCHDFSCIGAIVRMLEISTAELSVTFLIFLGGK